MSCNLGWNHMRDFKIEWAHSASSIFFPKYDFKQKLHDMRFNYHFYIHFEIAQIQDLVSSNILLMQYWAGLKLRSPIFWGKKVRVLETKVAKFATICHSLSFIFL